MPRKKKALAPPPVRLETKRVGQGAKTIVRLWTNGEGDPKLLFTGQTNLDSDLSTKQLTSRVEKAFPSINTG